MNQWINKSMFHLGWAYNVHRGKCKVLSVLIADKQNQNWINQRRHF